jgi:hypothetical protein
MLKITKFFRWERTSRSLNKFARFEISKGWMQTTSFDSRTLIMRKNQKSEYLFSINLKTRFHFQRFFYLILLIQILENNKIKKKHNSKNINLWKIFIWISFEQVFLPQSHLSMILKSHQYPSIQ